MNLVKKIIARIHTARFRKNISGKGRLLYTKDAHLMIDSRARMNLDGNLNLNANAEGRNMRSSLLRLDKNSVLNVEGNFSFMYGADVIVFAGGKLTLGNGSFINSDCKIRCSKEISIGENCAISHDFTVMDSDVHYLDGNNNTKPVIIGNYVWIGTRVTVLSGVTIGEGAVVAAGAIVKEDVPAHCLVAGVPARIVRQNVTWKK